MANASTGVTAALVWNSDLVDTSLGGFYVPDGIPAAFAATGGTVAPSPVDTLEGEAASTFTAGAVGGNFQVSVTVDGETVNTGVEVQGDLLSDDFETGDFCRWSDAVGAPLSLDPGGRSRDCRSLARPTGDRLFN